MMSWWAETAMMEANDICMSSGEKSASEDAELKNKHERKPMGAFYGKRSPCPYEILHHKFV